MGDLAPHTRFDVAAGRDGHLVVHVSGEIDLSARSLFQKRLDDMFEANDDDVVVDLADVSFIDSTGLFVLLQARERLETAGRKLMIARPSRPVTRVLELAGLDAVVRQRGLAVIRARPIALMVGARRASRHRAQIIRYL